MKPQWPANLLTACGLVNPARIRRGGIIAAFVSTLVLPQTTQAIPQFARENRLRCISCHIVPPRLNEFGLAFQASGYRLPEGLRASQSDGQGDDVATAPFAAWITAQYEDQGDGGATDLLLPKVELISGGTVGEKGSYFVEWRIVSLSLNSDGSLKDRGGRFEDLFFAWGLSERHALKLGQFRTLNQVDVSLRLSPSEPQLFGNGLATGTHSDPRIASLSRFSPSSRSPSIAYLMQSVTGESSSDGLFHVVTVPFIGEFSIPLSSEASGNASLELQGPPKGVAVETYYRQRQKSVGAHAFYDNDSWLVTAVGTWDWKNLSATAWLGVDDNDGRDTRTRSSFELESLFDQASTMRAAAGIRIENVSDDRKQAAYVPYLVVASPNTRYTFLLQAQYKVQEGENSLVFALSAIF